MRSFVLLVGLVAACTPHAGGESCAWVPGDDGSCERGGGGGGSGPTVVRHGSPSAAATDAGHRVVFSVSGDGDSAIETVLVGDDGAASEALALEVRGGAALGITPTVASDGASYLVAWKSWDGDAHAARFTAGESATDMEVSFGSDPRYLTATFGGAAYLVAWIDPGESALHFASLDAEGELVADVRQVASEVAWDRVSLAAGETGAVIAWQRSDDVGRELLALRLHPDGRAVDAEPIVLSRGDDDGDPISAVGPVAAAGDDLYVVHVGRLDGRVDIVTLDGTSGEVTTTASELTSVPNAVAGDERGLVAAVPAGDLLAVDRFDRAGRLIDSIGSFPVVAYYVGISLRPGGDLVVAHGEGSLEALRFDAHSSERVTIAEDYELDGGCRAGGASGWPGALLLLVVVAATRRRSFSKRRASMLPPR